MDIIPEDYHSTKTLKNKEEIEDFVRGCTFFGTGGGGCPEDGLKQLMRVYEEGCEIGWYDVSELPDDAMTVCAYGMGSIAPQTTENIEEMKSLGLMKETIKYKLAAAIKEMEKHTGKKIEIIVPLEIGGANTPDPVATAAHMGIKVVDGDYSGGRAIPEITQTTPHIHGESMIPLSSVDQWGNTCIIKKAVNNQVAEKIGKLISILAYGKLAGNATYFLKAGVMKKLVVPSTLSRAFAVGKLIRTTREADGDPVETARKFVSGWLLFKGKVTKKETEDKEGYYWGTNTIEGVDKFEGHTFKIWFKNENHISWFDDKPFATSPDLICVVNSQSGEPIANPSIKVGENIAILGVSANEIFRSKVGLEVLGPRHFGFDIDYIPIEKRV
ncbi:MAG TPA: DUF917 domain-containing protein [Thermoplasmata archaeon]|nr:DUF917 domain-containing protein [Thermoplasmata archaeon]